jgi:hypothetical protein
MAMVKLTEKEDRMCTTGIDHGRGKKSAKTPPMATW